MQMIPESQGDREVEEVEVKVGFGVLRSLIT